MTDGAAKLSGIAWGHFLRWFVRGRVFRLSIQVRSLTLSTLAVLLTVFGWWLIAQPFGAGDGGKDRVAGYTSCPWTPPRVGSPLDIFMSRMPSGPDMGKPPTDAVVDPWWRLSLPVVQSLNYRRTFVDVAFLSLCILWAALVWGLFGGAITRAALVQLTREEPVSLGASLRFAGRRWLSYFSAPIFPLLGIVVVSAGLMVLGWTMRASLLIGGIFWPLALVGGVVMAVLALGLLIGWPLMHSAIGAEGSDSFDALSRSYSYVYQRPMHYLLYLGAAILLGLLGTFVVHVFSGAVEALTAWGVSWGAGVENTRNAIDGTAEAIGKTSTLDGWGVSLINFWQGVVRAIVIGFAFAFLWTSAAAIYLLLRHDADGAELDEIFIDDGAETFPLPNLAADAGPSRSASVEPAPADIPSQPE
jgi:hypothetical protein